MKLRAKTSWGKKYQTGKFCPILHTSPLVKKRKL
jgi:hypothetical protein